MYILQKLKINLILCHSTKTKLKNWKKADTDSLANMGMPQLKPVTGPARAYQIKEYVTRKNSMELNPTGASRCPQQYPTASRSVNFAGET